MKKKNCFCLFFLIFSEFAFSVTESTAKLKVTVDKNRLDYKECAKMTILGGSKPYSFETIPPTEGMLTETSFCAKAKVFGKIKLIVKDSKGVVARQQVLVDEPFTKFSLDAKKWQCLICMNKVTKIFSNFPYGWYFDFPKFEQASVHYVSQFTNTFKRGRPIIEGSTIRARIRIEATTGTEFTRPDLKDNTSTFPPHGRLFFYTDDLLIDENSRWWSRFGAVKLEVGSFTVEAAVFPSEWFNVNGKMGSSAPEYLEKFRRSLRRAQGIGFTFGGGNASGHGVNVKNGEARFIVEDIQIDVSGTGDFVKVP